MRLLGCLKLGIGLSKIRFSDMRLNLSRGGGPSGCRSTSIRATQSNRLAAFAITMLARLSNTISPTPWITGLRGPVHPVVQTDFCPRNHARHPQTSERCKPGATPRCWLRGLYPFSRRSVWSAGPADQGASLPSTERACKPVHPAKTASPAWRQPLRQGRPRKSR